MAFYRFTRRQVASLFHGVAVTWSIAASAQTPPIPEIGFLSSISPGASETFVKVYSDGMTEGGYVNGRDVSITFRWAQGRYDELKLLANELAQRQVKVIVAAGGLVSAKAAMATTTTIPILFVSGGDPVDLGLVNSLGRPGGNATGASVFTSQLLPKRLELLHNFFGSRMQTIGVLINPEGITSKADEKFLNDAAQLKQYKVQPLMATTAATIAAAFESAAQHNLSALLVQADPFFTNQRTQIVELAARYSIPVMYPWREYVFEGGLMSYGPELTWAYHLIGQYTGRILKGENPGDLPVQQPTTFKLVLNLKTANALGLDIARTAPNLISLADEVIEP